MINKTAIIKLVIGVALGAIGGYAYYYFLGCQGGCPLSSNWFTTTAFGAFFGFVAMFPEKKRASDEQNN